MRDLGGFRDRRDAGCRLAERLEAYGGACDAVVLALSRGGVAIGYEIATRIGAALDVLVVRELGVPGHSGLAMGAIASGGLRVVDPRVAQVFGVSSDALAVIEARERAALERFDRAYHAGRELVGLTGRTAILVDDGIETAGAMSAAIDVVRTCGPARTIAAAPVASREICEALGDRADDMICLQMPERLPAREAWYDDFAALTDRQVCELIDAAGQSDARRGSARPLVGRVVVAQARARGRVVGPGRCGVNDAVGAGAEATDGHGRAARRHGCAVPGRWPRLAGAPRAATRTRVARQRCRDGLGEFRRVGDGGPRMQLQRGHNNSSLR